MQNPNLLLKYTELLEALKGIVISSQARVIQGDPDPLFSENVNFFVKSYLISACTYLEAYLQDIAFEVSQDICRRIKESKTPHNFLYWRTSKEVKEKELRFADADVSLSKKDISEEISANPYKTIKLFKYLGVNLFLQQNFVDNKDIVGAVVTKRNNIVHHNDSANDVSLSDIVQYIDNFVIYMEGVDLAAREAMA